MNNKWEDAMNLIITPKNLNRVSVWNSLRYFSYTPRIRPHLADYLDQIRILITMATYVK
jgi:hypothetical protein